MYMFCPCIHPNPNYMSHPNPNSIKSKSKLDFKTIFKFKSNSKFKIKSGSNFKFKVDFKYFLMCPKSIKNVMNGAPVAPHGLILDEGEATPSRNLFKHLPGPPRPAFAPQMARKNNKIKKIRISLKYSS